MRVGIYGILYWYVYLFIYLFWYVYLCIYLLQSSLLTLTPYPPSSFQTSNTVGLLSTVVPHRRNKWILHRFIAHVTWKGASRSSFLVPSSVSRIMGFRWPPKPPLRQPLHKINCSLGMEPNLMLNKIISKHCFQRFPLPKCSKFSRLRRAIIIPLPLYIRGYILVEWNYFLNFQKADKYWGGYVLVDPCMSFLKI